MTTPYNQLRQLLTDRLPQKPKTFDNFFIEQDFDLQDILLAIGRVEPKVAVGLDNVFVAFCTAYYEHPDGYIEQNWVHYDLTKPFADQSDEVLLALIELIK